MKTLIVFLGIAVIYIALLTYQSDGVRLAAIRGETERVAQECAAGGIQFFDAAAYGQGYMSVDAAAAEQFARDYVSSELTGRGVPEEGELKCKVYVENLQISDENPQVSSVTAKAEYKGNDFFRLPFLERDHLAVQVTYEVKGR